MLDRGPEEYYTSAPYRLPAEATAARISWDADIPPKTWLRTQRRFAATREALEHALWSNWLETGHSVQITTCGWAQYRLALGRKTGWRRRGRGGLRWRSSDAAAGSSRCLPELVILAYALARFS